MAYDPYYAGQYDYNQDGGYGYDGYGYDGYGYEDPYTPTPPPAPDKNWVDPVKVNKEYLKRIQKSCIHKGFEGLKEEGLFLLEMMARSVSLRKDVFESLASPEKKDKPFMSFVKILDMPFVEVNETEKVTSKKSSIEHRTVSLLANRKSFTNLFQSVFSATGDHDSLIPRVEVVTEGGGGVVGQNENQNRDAASVTSRKESLVKSVDTSIEKVEKIYIMKGKSVLLPMPALTMIQKLQQYPLILKITQCDVTDEDVIVEGEILATSLIRLPETFRKAVLMSCKPATVLPLVVVATNNHKLTDSQGWEVGDAELTLVLTCFGKGAVNCVTEFEDSHNYEHTFLLRHLKAKHKVTEENLSPVDPRLAKEIVKMGLFFPSRRTSSEILQHCISSNLTPLDDEERKHAQKKRDCSWFRMLKKACPSSIHSFDYEKYMLEMELERAALWRKHRKICRDLKNNEPAFRKSLEDRWKDIQSIQTGVTGFETMNPFEELARHSASVVCLKSFASNMSANGNFKKAYP